ncbi:BglG family transcription antiterminator [Clostridium lacusfryxellense]|uniref:BglG family transcription antiterminator n=1 Tax=Clostridium lacusfryxellense TaxID=205328 RepID=UPI001C0BA0AB|nr:BglG family transcription antiterminator [Clostridium lacusfryxellense]MBU3112728.1 BglG family transcription antiterminator [Clostridium lacusfryxellense]
MKGYKINSRIKNILQIICKEDDYVTISKIAKDLDVSGRTVLRDIPEVQNFLKHNGINLEKKTGVGIKVIATLEEKKTIINLLNGEINETIYSPLERKNIIISELLQNQEPVKLYNFTRILKVTEATISNDLEKTDEWFKKHGLKLIRKQGLGVYVEGREDYIRKAMVSLIYENTNESQLLGLIRKNLDNSVVVAQDIEVASRNRLLNLIDNETIKKLEVLVESMEKERNYKLVDSAFVGLIVHIALAIERVKKGDKITINGKFLKELKTSEEYVIASNLSSNISKCFAVDIPEDEIGYITMHIKGSKNYKEKYKAGNKVIGSFELVKLSKEIIKIAEIETGRFLGNNENLLNGLVNHLGTAITRLKMNLEIRNPLLEEIKANYTDLMRISTKCSVVVEKHIGIKMPEAEIAFIAMHLGAAIENSETLIKPIYKVAIACATGMGTSRLLATRIKNEYENIEIVDIISTIHIEKSFLMEKEIDFIISTVNIDKCYKPVVRVNPLLFQEDKDKIADQIKAMKNINIIHSNRKIKNINFKDKLISLNIYSEAIIQILDNFFLKEIPEISSIDALIIETSKLIERDTKAGDQLRRALKNREEKGNTVVTGHEMILLHCRTGFVKKLYFGAIKLTKGIECLNGLDKIENVKLAIIMLAPEECSKSHIEVIGYVSKNLIERIDFLKYLKAGNSEYAFSELNDILKEFYNQKVNN